MTDKNHILKMVSISADTRAEIPIPFQLKSILLHKTIDTTIFLNNCIVHKLSPLLLYVMIFNIFLWKSLLLAIFSELVLLLP